MIYGYARVSTDGQSVEAQVRQLRAVGAGECRTSPQRQQPIIEPAAAKRDIYALKTGILPMSGDGQNISPTLFENQNQFFSPVVVVVSTIAELRHAAKEQRSEIIFKLPEWLKPAESLPTLLHTIFLGMLFLSMFALVRGYNIEFVPKIIVKGVEISFSMKLTKIGIDQGDVQRTD